MQAFQMDGEFGADGRGNRIPGFVRNDKIYVGCPIWPLLLKIPR